MAYVFILPDGFGVSARGGNGGSGNGGVIVVTEQPIGAFGAPQKPLRYGPTDGVDETVVAKDPLKLAPPITVPRRDDIWMVNGLDRHTCWVRWCQNRDAIERGRGYAIHDLTDAQIAAAKLYHNGLRIREREMNGPPRPSKPKLTILVDQDIED